MGFADTWGAAIGGGAQIFGQKEMNERARHERIAQNKFTKMMSNTAHRREVNDLQKAGLNPLLSVNSGASTPSGSMAPVANEFAGAINAAKDMVSMKNIESDTMLKDSNSAINVKNLTKGSSFEAEVKSVIDIYNRYLGNESGTAHNKIRDNISAKEMREIDNQINKMTGNTYSGDKLTIKKPFKAMGDKHYWKR